MWEKLSKFILSNRFSILIIFFLVTVFMAFKASQVRLSFSGSKVLPVTDSAFIKYNAFKEKFGEDGSIMVLGVQSPDLLHKKEAYNAWSVLTDEIQKLNGVQQVLSVSKLFQLKKDTVNKKFIIEPLVKGQVQSVSEMDSVRQKIYNVRFFDGLIFNKKTHASLLAITFDKKVLNSKERIPIINSIVEKAEEFSTRNNLTVHYSGLPFIRTAVSELVSREFVLFLGLSILVAAIILLIFFRSFYQVIFPVLLVIIGVIWSLGFLVLFNYEITMLTGLIPPLMVIIGIPNSILLLNKYQNELRKGASKADALSITVQRMAETTMIANITAAIGFGVLYFTGSELLMQFGSIAAISVMATWLICLFLIPVVFSLLPTPHERKNVESRFLTKALAWTDNLVHTRRNLIYIATALVCVVAVVGILRVNINGYVVDDLPQNSPVYSDLKFFERNFEGVLPLEVSIDTRRPNGIMSLSTIKKMDKLERLIESYPEFSGPVSLNNALKFASQAFYNSDPQFYRLPNEMEKNFILSYVGNSGGNEGMIKNFLDKNRQEARISFQMADVGSKRMDVLLEELKPRIDSIFNPDRFNVELTGSSIIFIKGTDYLLRHLVESTILAIVLISLLRLGQFKDIRIMFISLLPNIVPLLITAGIMGFFGIALKPSTILIFSIAFGLASDQTIYFLTRYQQELKLTNYSVGRVISDTIKETGVSMTYIALILFFGFGIFTASTFGGTVALGILLSITLLVALVFNLTLLPALMLSYDKRKNRKRIPAEQVKKNLEQLD